jgi:uncharacterized repeat protein (TIGR01451 family)
MDSPTTASLVTMPVTLDQVLAEALRKSYQYLHTFSEAQDYISSMRLAFGNTFSIQKAIDLARAWATGDVKFPLIRIVPAELLNGTYGGYSIQTQTIYLASEFLYHGTVSSITSVLLEEYGHAIDGVLNASDSPGDEGAIFSAVVQGNPVPVERLQQLKAKDDTGIITLDGQLIPIEKTSFSDAGGEGGTTRRLTLPQLPSGQTKKGSITVEWSYEHFSIPDQFEVSYEGKNYFTTGGLVSGSKRGKFTFPRGNSNDVIIKVTAPQSGTAWNFTASADTCADTTPLEIQAVGGMYEDRDGNGECDFDGTIKIGRTDGTTSLIRIESSSSEFNNSQIRVKKGTVYSLIGGITRPLFDADFTIAYSTSKSSSFIESRGSSAGFKLANLNVDFNKIILEKTSIKLGVSFALPVEIAGQSLRISLAPDSNSALDIPNGLIIDNSGLRLGVTGAADLPNLPKDFKLFNLIKVSTANLKISYSNLDDVIKLQGKIQLSPFSRLQNPKTIEADFSNDNFIQIKNGQADFVGSISARNIPLIRGWELPEIKLFLDTTKNIVEGDVSVAFPFGRQPVLFRRNQAQVGFGIGFQNFELNAIRGSLKLPQPGIPIATTGFFVESLGGEIRNIAPSSQNPTEFTGTTKVVSRLAAGLASLDVSATVSSDKLSGRGRFEFIASDIVSATVDAELDWNKVNFKANGNFSFFDGLLRTDTKLNVNSSFDFSLGGKASSTIPKAFRGYRIPLIGGKSLPSVAYLVEHKNDSTLSNDFGALWATFPVTVPGTSVKRDVSAGLKVYFDGNVDVIFGSKKLPETNSFQVASGAQYIILSADWETSNSNVKVRIKKPDGSFFEEEDFVANNASIVQEFTDEDTRSVVIANPVPGIWDIAVVDQTGLGDIKYSGIGDSALPSIQIQSIAADTTQSNIFSIEYLAADPDSVAKVKFFYDDDNAGLDGLMITDSISENDGAGTYYWNTEGIAVGDYYVYAMIMDNDNIPVFSSYSPGKITISESADLDLENFIVGVDPLTSEDFIYRLSVTNKGTSFSKGVILQNSLPNEVTFISASTTPSFHSGSDLEFNLGDIAPGATRSLDLTVKAPNNLVTLLNTAEVKSKTFDPFIGDNFATLSTSVDLSSAPLADLSISSSLPPGNLSIGDKINYTFTVRNDGTTTASDVEFTTNLTANAGGVQNISTTLGFINNDIVTANLGSLKPGESRALSISADITAAGSLTTTASVSGNEIDPFMQNNSLVLQNDVDAIVPADADLELSLTSKKTTVDIDEIVTLRLALTNKGPGAATSIQTKSLLPPELTFISSRPQQGTYNSVSGIWDAGNIARDNQAFLDIFARVTSEGAISTTAEIVSATESDLDSIPNNNNPNEDDQSTLILNTKPTYQVRCNTNELFEGDRLSVSLVTSKVFKGRRLYWSFKGDNITGSDFADGMTRGMGVIGADGRYNFAKIIAADANSDPNETLEVRFFSDASYMTQIGSTLSVLIKEHVTRIPTDDSDLIRGTDNPAPAREIITGVPISSKQRGKQSIDILTGLGGPDTFVLGDGAGTFYDDGVASKKGSLDLGVIVDFSADDLIQLHGGPSDYRLSRGAYTGAGLTNMQGLYVNKVTPGPTDEIIGFVSGATLATLSLSNYNQFIYTGMAA